MRNLILILLGFALFIGSRAEALVHCADWNATNTLGWVCYDVVNERNLDLLEIVDGALSLRFATQSMAMPPEEYLIKADATACDGCFAGDYFAIGARSVSFRIFIEKAGPVSLVIGGSGKWWRCALNDLEPGGWQTVRVSLDPDVIRSFAADDNANEFAAMLHAVDWIGVSFTRAQSLDGYAVGLDDFTLSAAGAGYGDWISGYEGADVDKLATRDLTGDGTSNVAAWIAGVAADGSEGGFAVAASTGGGGSGKPMVAWRAVAGRLYQVLRTSNLSDPFVPVSDWFEVTGDAGSFEDISAEGEGPFYYKVVVRMAGE